MATPAKNTSGATETLNKNTVNIFYSTFFNHKILMWITEDKNLYIMKTTTISAYVFYTNVLQDTVFSILIF